VRCYLAKLGHSARTKGVAAAFVAAEYPPGDWRQELIAMHAEGGLISFLEAFEEDADAKARTESFVMITDTRILVFPDVALEPEVYTTTLVKDVRSLITLDDALELRVSSSEAGTPAPSGVAGADAAAGKTIRIALPRDKAREAGQELQKALASRR
jgi:hypothetical protein